MTVGPVVVVVVVVGVVVVVAAPAKAIRPSADASCNACCCCDSVVVAAAAHDVEAVDHDGWNPLHHGIRNKAPPGAIAAVKVMTPEPPRTGGKKPYEY